MDGPTCSQCGGGIRWPSGFRTVGKPVHDDPRQNIGGIWGHEPQGPDTRTTS